MLVCIIILFLVLLTVYFSTKEGMTTPRVTSTALITDNNPLPSNAAIYKTPIQMMDKINSILEGTVTKEETLNGELKTQNNKISKYSTEVDTEYRTLMGKVGTREDDDIPLKDAEISGTKKRIDDYEKIYIPNARAQIKLCNENGPTNKFIVDQPTIKGITDYITMLDTVYDKLKPINTELMNKYNAYVSQTATIYTKIYASFVQFPDNDTLEPNIYTYN